MFRCRLEEDSIVWPKVWRGAALAHAQVFPVISFGACATETCESRRLPETTKRDVSPIDSARSRCIRLQTFIELPAYHAIWWHSILKQVSARFLIHAPKRLPSRRQAASARKARNAELQMPNVSTHNQKLGNGRERDGYRNAAVSVRDILRQLVRDLGLISR
jgi:hypothetical protein